MWPPCGSKMTLGFLTHEERIWASSARLQTREQNGTRIYALIPRMRINARNEIKLVLHGDETWCVYYIVSMITTTTNSLRHFSLKLLLQSSNSLMAAHMEMKRSMHIISLTTTGIFSLLLIFIGACPLR